MTSKKDLAQRIDSELNNNVLGVELLGGLKYNEDLHTRVGPIPTHLRKLFNMFLSESEQACDLRNAYLHADESSAKESRLDSELALKKRTLKCLRDLFYISIFESYPELRDKDLQCLIVLEDGSIATADKAPEEEHPILQLLKEFEQHLG